MLLYVKDDSFSNHFCSDLRFINKLFSSYLLDTAMTDIDLLSSVQSFFINVKNPSDPIVWAFVNREYLWNAFWRGANDIITVAYDGGKCYVLHPVKPCESSNSSHPGLHTVTDSGEEDKQSRTEDDSNKVKILI